jgi:hypothetical protein
VLPSPDLTWERVQDQIVGSSVRALCFQPRRVQRLKSR